MSPAVAEAIAWIEQAEALLDQAHGGLKGEGLNRVLVGFGSSTHTSWVDISQLREMVALLAENVREAANAE